MKDVENLLTTDYIYFPLKKDSKLFINDGEYVYKNDKLIEYNNKIIYSSISGKVLGMTNIDNNKYLVIENDYKDKTKKRITSKKNINNYTKEELNNLINEYNIIDNFDITSKVLIINCIDEYNLENTNNTILKNYTINLLDTIDALIDIMDIKKCFFAVSNNDIEVVDITYGVIGDYFENANIEMNKKLGVLVNLGYSKCEIAIFNKGIMLKGEVLPIGSKKIDKDISYIYKIDRKQAISLKEEFAVSSSKYADMNNFLEITNLNGEKIKINQVEISQVIEARLKEILKSVKSEINNLTNRSISYIIITGGITNLVGFPYLVEEEFKIDKVIANLTTIGVRSNMYSTSFGLIKYFAYKAKSRNIDYLMFDLKDKENLASKKKKVSTRDNLIGKIEAYLKS